MMLLGLVGCRGAQNGKRGWTPEAGCMCGFRDLRAEGDGGNRPSEPTGLELEKKAFLPLVQKSGPGKSASLWLVGKRSPNNKQLTKRWAPVTDTVTDHGVHFETEANKAGETTSCEHRKQWALLCCGWVSKKRELDHIWHTARD